MVIKMNGTLYLCATPIGNLADISQRFVETMELADLVAAEDTRVSIKLLNHLNLPSYLSTNAMLTALNCLYSYEELKNLCEEILDE